MISFQTANLRIDANGDGRSTLWLDAVDRNVNVFNRQVMADLGAALDHLAADRSLQILIVRSAKASGFAAGADDYLVKPYALAELAARVEALARRRETGSVQTLLRVGDLEMDLIGRQVRRDGKAIDLQPREFQLLEFLMRHGGQSVTRTMLLEKVWGYHFDPQTNVIDVHISRLRSKIDKGFERAMLQTVRGAGYRLEA